ncbi:hypothetical protein EYV94_25985 [Puteibacter caeruleilacunae]|nr:hypothetical protein EYV94_25985 [Puteibacter caeruleilacunae]
MVKYIFLLITVMMLVSSCLNTNRHLNNDKTMNVEYVGKAVQKTGFHVWGSSPIIDKDGKVHLYVSEWPIPSDSTERFTGWFKHCQIAHYVGNKAEGPFEFIRYSVKDLDGDFNSPHNPTIKYIDNKYVLCFIVNEDDDLSKQRIMMYVSDDLNDNWEPAKGAENDGTMLRVPNDKNLWNNKAILGVSNPTLLKNKDEYMLYFKSVLPHEKPTKENHGKDYGYGVALSNKLEGPYKIYPKRVTGEGTQLEDAYVYKMDDKVCLVSRDYLGSKGSNGGGLFWSSSDGMFFNSGSTYRAYEDLAFYVGEEGLKNAKVYRGNNYGHLERPQLLCIEGKPKYMYVATGVNDFHEFGSASHVFRVN